MNNLESFQEALTQDLNRLGSIRIKTLQAKELYWPFAKVLGMIYYLLSVLAIITLTLCVGLGTTLTQKTWISILYYAFMYNLIPVVFLACGLGQGFILWYATKGDLKSAPFIEALFRHYLKCYCILYVALLFIFTELVSFGDLEMIMPFSIIISMVLMVFFMNMENQRLGQGVLIRHIETLFSRLRASHQTEETP